MLLAGLKRGEVTALTWFDIDFKNRVINVNKSYDFKQCELKETKAKAGMRKIPMNDFLYNLLLEAKKHSKGSYIVQKAYGGRMTETAWKRLFESYMEALRAADGRDEDSLCFADERFEESVFLFIQYIRALSAHNCRYHTSHIFLIFQDLSLWHLYNQQAHLKLHRKVFFLNARILNTHQDLQAQMSF